MTPVSGGDLRDIAALKASPLAFAQMLGGVRSLQESAEEMAADIACWGANGWGMWTVRARDANRFLGLAGLETRQDGLGVALRFAFWPQARGVGLATEAAGAALIYGHETAGLREIVAIAREDNFASRTILGAIGMAEAGSFSAGGVIRLIYRSTRGGL